MDKVLGFFDNIRTSMVYKLADILKFEDEAKRQYRINPSKFQMQPIKKAKSEDAFK